MTDITAFADHLRSFLQELDDLLKVKSKEVKNFTTIFNINLYKFDTKSFFARGPDTDPNSF